MTLGEGFLYGAVQGLTEYLPISSSAHLILLPRFLGSEDPGLAFDVFLHLGTLLATLSYFYKDWKAIALSALGRQKSGITWPPIVLGTVPALVAGALIHKWAETSLRSNWVLVCTLSLGGVALWAADRFASAKRDLGKLALRDAAWVGLAQCLALIPGMSRSGSTILGGRLLGFERAAAARFSFLLSAPITAAALVFELRKWNELTSSSIGPGPLLVSAVSAMVFGWIAIGGLLRLVRRYGYLAFAIYRVALALVIYFALIANSGFLA